MMTSITIETEKLTEAIRRYRDLSGKTIEEVLIKHGREFSLKSGAALRAISPAKGAIREQQMKRFAAHGGIRVSPWVKKRISAKFNVMTSVKTRRQYGVTRQKKQTKILFGVDLWKKMVEMEISSRESGRGFLGASTKFGSIERGDQNSISRVGPRLGTASLKVGAQESTITFSWGNVSGYSASAAHGMQTEKGRSAMARALAATTANIMVYVDRKVGETTEKAGLK